MQEGWYPVMDLDAKLWVRWEEETVSSDRGRREVHYYVRDDCGGRDLAVVGREKSARHMIYVIQAKFLQSLIQMADTASPSSVAAAANAVPADRKLRTRKHVVDWLSLLVSDSMPYRLPPMLERYTDDEDPSTANTLLSKALPSSQLAHLSEEFLWLGSAWNCKKGRKHYQSFNRKGIRISVNDFIYVLTDDNNRLVAYIEDLYEDMMANNMVSVRWFHKVDEVSIVLPPSTNDREIFFSLCLQDFSVECIDGLAAVLGIEDFEKFQKDELRRYRSWEPYLCRWLIDEDGIKPLDITLVPGYWSQSLLRSMYPSYLKLRLKIKSRGSNAEEIKKSGDSKDLSVGNGLERDDRVAGCFREEMTRGLTGKVPAMEEILIVPGQEIEVLSNDSGIRGCWFCCVVLKRRHDKIKVKYQHVQDADGMGKLEEWVSTSRIAAPDKAAIRLPGRPIVRPTPSNNDKSSSSYVYGKVVDAWWHDGWWEGVVIGNDDEENIRVYFSGEQRVSAFCPSDLRPSQEWVDSRWNPVKERPDVATLVLAKLDSENCTECITSPSDTQPEREASHGKENQSPPSDPANACPPQLIKNFHGDGLRWYSTRKRTNGRPLFGGVLSSSKRLRIRVGHKCSRNSRSVLLRKPMKVAGEQENCKVSGDPLFGAPMAFCSSLVMTR